MNHPTTPDEGLRKLREFLEAGNGARVFEWPTGHPSQPTGFCPCDRAFFPRVWFYGQAAVLLMLLKWPFNRLKLAALRRRGAHIGRNVHISSDVWIDPIFPELLTIEDDVLIGVGAKIAMHEFGCNCFRAGRVAIRRGALVGGFALIGHGVEIGPGAVVAGGAVVGRDVPAGMMAVGNPARVFPTGAVGAKECNE
ncbi:MAG: acetyltransferase [Verrucomicrobia bacterium]|nr:acetyltransferase [Verrucomicrobiota bacterium]